MSLQVVIPYLVHPWALEDCIESFGSSAVPVMIVDNSPDQFAKSRRWTDNVTVVSYGKNIGIAAAWNLGLRAGADQTLICSQWVRFAPAEFPRRVDGEWGLDYIAQGVNDHATEYGCTLAEQGFHLISVGRKLVEEVGYFDEVFTAYGEDDDYRWRMNLAGLGGSMGSWPKPNVFSIGYGIAKRTPDAIQFPDQRLTSGTYWRLKWGNWGSNEPVAYTTPFNSPDNTVAYCPAVKL